MSDLIDRNVLKANMYQEAFESDTVMQKWDSGCWIRYKLFEKVVDSTPTVPYGPRWHRVEEPPKEDGKYVAINVKTKWWYEATYENGNWKAVDLFGQRWVVIHPTHWMPIEPPKEDA